MPVKITRKTGDRHGRLVIIREVKPDRWGSRLFLFKCDCGKLVIARWGTTVSCGCAQRDFVKNNLNYSKRLPYGESCFNLIYNRYKCHARAKRRKFLLTKSQFRELVTGNCSYCGIAPSNTETKNKDAYGEFIYNGLDRVDNLLGYTVENTVTCCQTCNIAKRNMSKTEFLAWIERVYNYQHLCER
jgi:hypothetical protein